MSKNQPELSQEEIDRIYRDFFDGEININDIIFMLAGAVETVWTSENTYRKAKTTALCNAAITRIRSVGV